MKTNLKKIFKCQIDTICCWVLGGTKEYEVSISGKNSGHIFSVNYLIVHHRDPLDCNLICLGRPGAEEASLPWHLVPA